MATPSTRLPSARPRRSALLGLTLMLPAFGAAFCEQPPVNTGINVDRVSDAVLLTPDPAADKPTTYLVTANPAVAQLRVFNATTGLTEAAPNVFFTLAVETGVATRALARSALDHTRFVAVDGVEGRGFVVRSDTADDAQAFTHVGQPIALPRGTFDAALAKTSAGFTLATVAADLPALTLTRFTDDAAEAAQTVDLPAVPAAVVALDDDKMFAVAYADHAAISVIDVATGTVTLEAPTTAGFDVLASGVLPMADTDTVVLAGAHTASRTMTVLAYDPAGPTLTERAGLALPTAARTLYVPDQRTQDPGVEGNACCLLSVDAAAPMPDAERAKAFIAAHLVDGDVVYMRAESAWAGADAVRPFAGAGDPELQVASALLVAPDGLTRDLPAAVCETAVEPGRALDWPERRYIGVFEGALPGLTARPATLDGTMLSPRGGTWATAQTTPVAAGDIVQLAAPGCDTVESAIDTASDATLTLAGPADDAWACVSGSDSMTATVLAAGDWLVTDTLSEAVHRVAPVDTPACPAAGVAQSGFAVAFGKDADTARGTSFIVDIRLGSFTAFLALGQTPADRTVLDRSSIAGLGSALIGGPTWIKNATDDSVSPSRRMFLTTEAGLLVEFASGETALANVQSYR